MTRIPSLLLAWRHLWARPARTLLTLLGIVLGVSVVLAIQSTNETTLDSLRTVFDRATGQAHLVVVAQNASKQPISDDLPFSLKKVDGVEIAAPALYQTTLLASEASSWEITFSMTGVAAGNFFLLYGVDFELDPQVRVYALAEGHLPEAEKYQAILPLKTATEKKLQIGDKLALLAPDGILRLEIVGLLKDEGVSIINDGMIAFTSFDVIQETFARDDELDEILIRVRREISDNPQGLAAFKQTLQDRAGKGAQVIYPAARGQLVSQMLATYQLGLTFFSLIAIFVGAFLIYNAFSMTVVERTREIGMLRAIGMGRWGILSMVLAEASLLSLVGSAAGLGLGVLLARGLILLLGNTATATLETVQVSAAGILQSLVVGIGVTLVAALWPAFQASRIQPLEALRLRGRQGERPRPIFWISGLILLFVSWASVYQIQWPDQVIFPAGIFALSCTYLGATLTISLATGWLEILSRPLAFLLYRQEGALGSANVRRALGRTMLTVASLMAALTMIIGISSLAYSFEQDMSNWITNALGGDLYVRAALPMRLSFAQQLHSVPGVRVVTPSRYLTVRLAPGSLGSDEEIDETLYFNAIEPETFRLIGDMEFAANQGDPEELWAQFIRGKSIFISNVISDRYHIQPGDQLVLLTSRGEQAFQVAAVVMDFGGQGQVVYGTFQDMQRWFNKQDVDRFTIAIQPGYTVEEVSETIKQRYQASRNISLQTTQEFKQSILNLMNQSFALFDVLNGISVIIGALGVINTLSMNVLERQREIGGLRSLGMTQGQVLRMVLAEALSLGAIGGVYGILVGDFTARVMIAGTNMMIGYDLAYRFTPDPYVISAILALGVVQVAAIFPARRAAQINMIEAIKHE